MPHIDAAKRYRWSRPVIIAVVLLAMAAIFWAVERAGNNNDRSHDVNVATGAGGAMGAGSDISPVADYLQFVGTAGTRAPDVEYIVDGLRKLAGALGTLNLGSLDLQVDLRVAAEQILLNPASRATTEFVRSSLISAAEAIKRARQDDDVNLRRLAEAIRPDVALLDQHAAMREFFEEFATAIRRLPGDA